jgi:hypothetical protein
MHIPILSRYIDRVVAERVAAAIPVVDSNEYWRDLTTPNYLSRPWYEHRTLLESVRDVCDENPIASRIVALAGEFTIGQRPEINAGQWETDFWDHPHNRLTNRLTRWAEELARSGELFLTLHRNEADGMSYVREVPAYLVDAIEADPHDSERPLRYHQLTDDADGLWWLHPNHPDAAAAPAVMVHYTINRPVGDLRGTSDLAQIVVWLERYDMWLEDRVRINRYKGAYLWHVRIDGAMPGQLEAKRAQYSRPPTSGSIIVTDGTETWSAVSPGISADAVEADGKAIRLMIAAGSGIPLHLLGEGESATRATAREMGTSTFRHFSHRQQEMAQLCAHLVRVAAARVAPHAADDLAEERFQITFEPVTAEADRRENGDQSDRAPAPTQEVQP